FALSTGDYICFLDHDDELTVDALAQFAFVLNETRCDIIYSDEDKIDEAGVRHDHHFKSDFNYTLLLAYNYICHFVAVKRKIYDSVGGLRTSYNGSQDYDFMLRCVELTSAAKIKHVPLVLYHWRVHSNSTALDGGIKSYAKDAGLKALRDHFERTRQPGHVKDAGLVGYSVTWPLGDTEPLVSIIIPTRDGASILALCLSGIFNRTDYKNFEVIIVDNGSVEMDTLALFAQVSKRKNVKLIRYDNEFNYADICNIGASAASGQYLLMLNNDIEVIDSNWLSLMVGHARRKNIGAVGAKLLYPDGRVQHSGVILGIGGVAGHGHKMSQRHDYGYYNRAVVDHELSACTAACLLIEREIFWKVKGFDADNLAVAFNDVDLCLKIRRAGYSVVLCNQAVLYHHESISRGADSTGAKLVRAHAEIAFMNRKWGKILDSDPFYSPNLTLDHEDFRIDENRGYVRAVLKPQGRKIT
ncbi:glycosyltransferase family 2 protein, partial [Nostoc sp. CHAB 5834]|nr:glycosyltransferase family 2 protein [Nostoc sp. CHAB 5834]